MGGGSSKPKPLPAPARPASGQREAALAEERLELAGKAKELEGREVALKEQERQHVEEKARHNAERLAQAEQLEQSKALETQSPKPQSADVAAASDEEAEPVMPAEAPEGIGPYPTKLLFGTMRETHFDTESAHRDPAEFPRHVVDKRVVSLFVCSSCTRSEEHATLRDHVRPYDHPLSLITYPQHSLFFVLVEGKGLVTCCLSISRSSLSPL